MKQEKIMLKVKRPEQNHFSVHPDDMHALFIATEEVNGWSSPGFVHGYWLETLSVSWATLSQATGER